METENVVLAIADISGYTKFVLDHQKAMVHGQMVIGELLNQLVENISAPLKMIELEGDAVFMYAPRAGSSVSGGDYRRNLGEQLVKLLQVFRAKTRELQTYSMCKCTACANIEKLKLKIVVHSGEAVFNNVGRFGRLSGVDVIMVHRLLKNSVNDDEYLLLTDPALADVAFPSRSEIITSEEVYDVGTIKTHVYIPGTDGSISPDAADIQDPETSSMGREILRYEIQQEYTEVANNPEKGFHFHTGSHLAGLLEYDPQWYEAVSPNVVESFAGTGNPFKLGDIRPGDRVVDVGSGSGFDSFIAAHLAGSNGHVIGVDMTLAMLQKAEAAAAESGMQQIEFKKGYAESLPVPDGWADVVISNGVVNLCPDKSAVFSEMYRVLKPGGRIQVADLLVQEEVPEAAKKEVDLWTG